MKTKGVAKLLLGTVVASAIGMSGSSVLAQSISYVENNVATGTTGVSLTTDPVVTAILSQPGTVDGKTYSSWSFLVNDGTGSMDVFGSLSGLGFTPSVGETISVTGEYSPYNQIPELEDITSISAVGTGTVPSIGTATIPQLNVDTLPYSIAGYEVTVDDVMIGGISSFGTSNQTGTITDGAANSMTLYYWESSYSSALQNLDGMSVASGQEYDVTGFVDVYSSSSPEFIPVSVVAVPEPGALSLCGMGGLMLFRLLRRRTA
ncbi:MAG TPA: hypothetical protein VMF08_10140 [Candidatus Sulfotelmatobacter sp.]|nr:hypothetical protein [Candidatus Sulfotelmatobacter sp.]